MDGGRQRSLELGLVFDLCESNLHSLLHDGPIRSLPPSLASRLLFTNNGDRHPPHDSGIHYPTMRIG
eukprot:2863169-Rhodomonas_salina.1